MGYELLVTGSEHRERLTSHPFIRYFASLVAHVRLSTPRATNEPSVHSLLRFARCSCPFVAKLDIKKAPGEQVLRVLFLMSGLAR